MTKKEEKEVPEPTKYDVTILLRREITTRPRLGEEVEEVIVTYVAANMAPRTINIPKEDYNLAAGLEDFPISRLSELDEGQYSLEVEKVRIRQDIEERLAQKREAYKV